MISAANADTVQWTSPLSGNWFDATNWNGPVPNEVGDHALLIFPTNSNISIAVTSPVVVGTLDIGGQSNVSLTGTGPLTFDNTGFGNARLRVFPASRTHHVSVPIAVLGDGMLDVETFTGTTITLAGGITSGDLTKTGQGELRLTAPDWHGQLRVREGTVRVDSATGLGSTIGSTIVSGGTVHLGAAVAEPISLEAGSLQGGTSSPQGGGGYVDYTGLLSVLADNTATVGGLLRLRGGSTGPGRLHLVAGAVDVLDQPLAHTGGLTIGMGPGPGQTVTLRDDNSYSGVTRVDHAILVTRTANSLGSSVDGTEVVGGELRLHGSSAESVHLDNSLLRLWTAEVTVPEQIVGGHLKLESSTIDTYGEFRGAGVYRIQNPVVLDGGLNTIKTTRGRVRLEGGVSGVGDLVIDPNSTVAVEINGPLSHNGTTTLLNGNTSFNSVGAFGGVLHMQGATAHINASQEIDRIEGIIPENSCCGSSGSIIVAPGSTLTTSRVNLNQGTLKGDIRTEGPIRYDGILANRTISNLISGIDLNINGGEVVLDDSDLLAGATHGNVSVNRTTAASLLIASNSRTDATVYLNNGTGFNLGGALRTNNDSSSIPNNVMRGDIHLGSNGAHIGGEDGIRLEGQIYGGDLNLGRRRADPQLTFVSGPAAYTGETRIFSGGITVAENGKLSNTSKIKIYSGGALFTDVLPSDGALADRIADHLEIEMYGGEVSAWPTAWGMNAQERIGNVSLKRGISTLRSIQGNYNALQTRTELVVGQLTREPGTILTTRSDESRHDTEFVRGVGIGTVGLTIETLPPQVNGFLPAWINNGNSFMTADAQGRISSYEGPFASFTTANTAARIVRPPTSPSIMPSDKTIHALYAFGNTAPVDLGGHTLTVNSGGLSGAALSNGTIRAGAGVNELIFFAGTNVSANIVDNGAPTTVTIAGDATLAGSNTYTGKTYIIGRPGDNVRIENPAALPRGGHLDLSGYVSLDFRTRTENEQYEFGEIAIRDGASINTLCCGFNETFAAEQVVLEDGRLSLPLSGDFPIIKTTEGLGRLEHRSPGFAGHVDVREGILVVGDSGDGFQSLGSATVTVHPGAQLVLAPGGPTVTPSTPRPSITLAGGSLYGTGSFSSNSSNLTGTLEVTDNSTFYALNGQTTNLTATRLRIDGSIHIREGKSFSVMGWGNSGNGLYLTEGFQFEPGAILGGTGTIHARVEIASGAVLSPGDLEGLKVGAMSIRRPNPSEGLNSELVWGENGIYRWEINDASGLPGAPYGEGWDLMDAGPLMTIDATAENPFIIEIVGLAKNGDPGLIENLLSNSHYRWKIAEVDQINLITGFDPAKFLIDVSELQQLYPQVRSQHFWLEQDGRGIFLNGRIIPEPHTLTLLTTMCVSLLARRARQLSSSQI